MNDLVVIKGAEAVCDTLEVAEKFGKDHKNILKTIDSLTAQNLAVKKMFHEGEYKANNGHTYRKIYMTRDGFTLLAMGFTGKEAIAWKLKYIEAFNRMEELLQQKQTQIWQDSRALSKQIRQRETDIIKMFVKYATDQGSQHATRYYTSFSRLADKVAGITDRDQATFGQLSLLAMVENIISKCITEGIELQEPYKEIYGGCKIRLESFRQAAMIE